MIKAAANEVKITAEEEAVLLWQYRMLGHFRTALFEAIARADQANLSRLRMGFPIEVGGFDKFTNEEGWWHATKEKARAAGWNLPC